MEFLVIWGCVWFAWNHVADERQKAKMIRRLDQWRKDSLNLNPRSK